MGRFSKVLDAAHRQRPTQNTTPSQVEEARIEPVLVKTDASLNVETPKAEAPASPARPTAATKPKAEKKAPSAEEAWLDAKMLMHSRLIDEIDLSALERLGDAELRKEVHELVVRIARNDKLTLNAQELRRFSAEVYDEMTGLGPLEPLLQDESIADILINGHDQVYVERSGELVVTPVRFRDDAHLLRIINRIVSQVGRRVDESQPLCDARLLDGSRVNVAVAPIAVDGPLVSIRKFSKTPFTFDKLVEFGAMPQEVAHFLQCACAARVTAIISGGTGSGKTTLLNALSQSISHKERLITIEDAAELQLQQPHVARMETRPPNVEGKGEIKQRELVKNALRMRPDRVILGEVRGEEAFDMLQAMNTGHEGSLATLHANTPRDAITRLEQMVAMGDMKISPEAVAGQIASAIGIIIQASRLSDGKRKIMSVAEITGMEGAIIQMQEIFVYAKLGTDADGNVIGEHRATGIRPKCLDDIITRGLDVPLDTFKPGTLGPKADLSALPSAADKPLHAFENPSASAKSQS